MSIPKGSILEVNVIEKIKQERNIQWGSNKSRGWTNYRPSTFMEVIIAKLDRALITQQLFKEIPENAEKYKADGLDSLYDARNYLNELLSQLESGKVDFLSNDLK